MQNQVGRPMKFPDLITLNNQIQAYFQHCDETTEPYTITGLALYLDTSRETLINYQEREEYFDTIKKAKDRVENYAERKLFTSNPTGPIFALKNFGWRDKQETEHTGSIQINVVAYSDSDNRTPQLPTEALPVGILESAPAIQGNDLAPARGQEQDSTQRTDQEDAA